MKDKVIKAMNEIIDEVYRMHQTHLEEYLSIQLEIGELIMNLTNEQHFRDLADAINEITDNITKIGSGGITISASRDDRYCVKIIINDMEPVTSITFDMSKDNSIANKHISFDTKDTDELVFSNLNVSDVERYNKVLTNLETLIKQAKFDYQDAQDAFYMFVPFE